MFYLSRMPGTANQHQTECKSHVVDVKCEVGADEIPADDVLNKLLQIHASNLPEKRNWGALRSSLLQAAGQMRVDGAPLTTHLLIPEPFDRERFAKFDQGYEAFYSTQGGDTNKQARYWTLGLLKDSVERQFSFQTTLKHMPSTKFWVHKDIAMAFPKVQGDSVHLLCLFSCRKVKSGIEVDEAAWAVVGSDLVVFKPAEAPTQAEIQSVIAELGLPADYPEVSVYGLLVREFLSSKGTK